MIRGKYRSPAAVIIFTIITCGVYSLYWIYKCSEELKEYTDRPDISPGMELLLCIICVPYSIYWAYKYGKIIYDAQKSEGLYAEDNTLLYVLLAVFGFFVVAAAIMQSNMNRLWDR